MAHSSTGGSSRKIHLRSSLITAILYHLQHLLMMILPMHLSIVKLMQSVA
uniref:Uncharacterized protein n=1 Tax=Arundo donax TaxID=35708 RepID=A0A0A9EE60_ARUDO